MRQNPHVRICGGPGSATTLVYPTAFSVGGSVAKPGLAKAAVAVLAVGDAIMKIAVGVRGLVKQIKLILTQLNRIESKLDRVIESLEKGQREKRKTARSR